MGDSPTFGGNRNQILQAHEFADRCYHFRREARPDQETADSIVLFIAWHCRKSHAWGMTKQERISLRAFGRLRKEPTRRRSHNAFGRRQDSGGAREQRDGRTG